ncbi:hypothetical protein A2U01_0083794, partial [Trifolium medium]|nr:hypothetical protein [Trifolium medium]
MAQIKCHQTDLIKTHRNQSDATIQRLIDVLVKRG